MKRLILFRHAHSLRQQLAEMGAQPIHLGRTAAEIFAEVSEADNPLTSLGFEQRTALTEYVHQHLFPNLTVPQCWISSPYKRALDTGSQLGFGPPLKIAAYAERYQGSVEDIHPDLRRSFCEAEYDAWQADPYFRPIPGGESLADLYRRVWTDIPRRISGESETAIICHEQIIWMIRQGMEGLSVEEVLGGRAKRGEQQVIKNCCVIVYADQVPQGEVLIPRPSGVSRGHFGRKEDLSHPFRYVSIVNPAHIPRSQWKQARQWRDIRWRDS